jgi:general secretion pathway protein I
MIRAARGFTLIEVLVALVIVAVGVGALASALVSAASGTERLRSRTLAEWVATNRIIETRLAAEFPPIGRSEGESVQGNRRWLWQQEIERTALDGVVQIAVSVRDAESPDTAWLVTLRGARGRDVARGGNADLLWDTASRTAP